jgi:hypothetical protein
MNGVRAPKAQARFGQSRSRVASRLKPATRLRLPLDKTGDRTAAIRLIVV